MTDIRLTHLVSFAQTLYGRDERIKDINVLTVNPFEYIIQVKDHSDNEDSYWVNVSDDNPANWTWTRSVGEAEVRQAQWERYATSAQSRSRTEQTGEQAEGRDTEEGRVSPETQAQTEGE